MVLAPGEYDLSTAREVKSRYVSWQLTKASDDYELVLSSVSGLTLRGEAGARIVTPPPYAYVLTIVDSQRVRLQDLGIGHRVQAFCLGGILRLERSGQAELEGLDLWGSGALGLIMFSSEQVTVERTTIRECTSGAVWIYNSSAENTGSMRVDLSGTEFRGNTFKEQVTDGADAESSASECAGDEYEDDYSEGEYYEEEYDEELH